MLRAIYTTLATLVAMTALADGLDVHLIFSPAETLPGVPVLVTVSVSNTSSTPVAFSSETLQFDVTSPMGESYESSVTIPTQFWYGEWERPAKYILGPGDKKQLFFRPGSSFETPVFNELPINEPGEYDLSVTVKGSRGRSGVSNIAHLRVNSPLGDDLVIWKELSAPISDLPLMAVSTPGLCPLIKQYPRSQYYRVLSAFCTFHQLSGIGGSPEKMAPAAMQAAAVLPPEAQDTLRFEIGQVYKDSAHAAYFSNRQAEAARISILGSAFALEMTQRAGTDFGRVAGGWLERQFHTEREWRQLWAESNGPMQPERAIVPFVNCVTVNPDGTISADFGYHNPNNHAVKRAAGERNNIKAESSVSTGPLEFRLGRVETAFTVKNAKGSVTWTLDGQTVTASPATAPRCEDLTVPW